MLRIGILCQSASSGEQLAHGGDVAAILVFARAHHGSLRLHHIRVAVQRGVHRHGVAVAHVKVSPAVFVERIDRKATAFLAHHVYYVLIGIAGKAAGIFEQRGEALVRFHFIHHRAFHLTCYIYKAVVGVHRNHVVRSECHVAFQVAVEDIVVDVHRRDQLAAAIHLDVAQRADIVRAAGHVERVEHGGECRERVRAGVLHLAHHVHTDRLRLSHGELNVRARVVALHHALHPLVGLCHSQSVHVHWAAPLDRDGAFGRHSGGDALLRCAPNVDVHGVARTESVVLRNGHIHVALKREVLIVEDVAAKHLFLLPLIFTVSQFVGKHHVKGVGQHKVEGICVLVHFLLFVAFALKVVHLALVHASLVARRLPLLEVLVLLSVVLAACLSVVLAHTVNGLRTINIASAHHVVLILLFVFIANAPYVVHAHAPFNEFLENLFARRALIVFLDDKFHNLAVRHRRLRQGLTGKSEEEKKQGETCFAQCWLVVQHLSCHSYDVRFIHFRYI